MESKREKSDGSETESLRDYFTASEGEESLYDMENTTDSENTLVEDEVECRDEETLLPTPRDRERLIRRTGRDASGDLASTEVGENGFQQKKAVKECSSLGMASTRTRISSQREIKYSIDNAVGLDVDVGPSEVVTTELDPLEISDDDEVAAYFFDDDVLSQRFTPIHEWTVEKLFRAASGELLQELPVVDMPVIQDNQMLIPSSVSLSTGYIGDDERSTETDPRHETEAVDAGGDACDFMSSSVSSLLNNIHSATRLPTVDPEASLDIVPLHQAPSSDCDPQGPPEKQAETSLGSSSNCEHRLAKMRRFLPFFPAEGAKTRDGEADPAGVGPCIWRMAAVAIVAVAAIIVLRKLRK